MTKSSSVLLERGKRLLLAVAGLIVFAFGVYLQLQANIGQAPWNALNQGLSMHLPISYGTACNAVACCIVLIDVALGEPVGLGMLLDAFVIGCNVSDIFPDVTVEITSGGETVDFSPFISLKDGSVQVGECGLNITRISTAP